MRISYSLINKMLYIAPFFLIGINYLSGIGAVYTVLILWCCASIGMIMLMYIRRRNASQFWILLLMYFGYSIAISVFRGTASLGYVVVGCGQVLVVCALIHMQPQETLKAIVYINIPIAAINFTSFLVNLGQWSSMQNGSLLIALGGKNAMARVLLPIFLMVCFYYATRERSLSRKSRRSICLVFLITIVPTVGMGSSTGIVACVFVCVWLVAKDWLPVTFRQMLLGFFVLETVFPAVAVFTNFVANRLGGLLQLLGKSSTMTGRSLIWERALQMFFESPVFGHGNGSVVPVIIPYGGAWNYQEAHNTTLDILKNFGLVGFALFVLILLQAAKKANAHSGWVGAKYLIGGICALLIVGMQEYVLGSVWFWILLAYAYHLDRMIPAPRMELRKE